MSGEVPIGVMLIQSRKRRAFSEHDTRLLMILANAVASALVLANLRAQLEFRTLQLVLIREISRRLASLQPLRELFIQVASLISETLGYRSVRLYESLGGELILRAASEGRPAGGRLHRLLRPRRRRKAALCFGRLGPSPRSPRAAPPRAMRKSPCRFGWKTVYWACFSCAGITGDRSPPSMSAWPKPWPPTWRSPLEPAISPPSGKRRITTVLREVARPQPSPEAPTRRSGGSRTTTLLAGTPWAVLQPLADGEQPSVGLSSASGAQPGQLADLRVAPANRP
jgi:hypothetical protein